MGEQFTALSGEGITGGGVLGQPGRREVAQASRQDAGGHLTAGGTQRSEWLRVLAQLPQDPQRPAASEEIEQVADRVAMSWRHFEKQSTSAYASEIEVT